MRKVNHRKLCKKLKFDRTTKWYKHTPEYPLENETHKVLWDFEIPTTDQILARGSDRVIINKKEKKPNKNKNETKNKKREPAVKLYS